MAVDARERVLPDAPDFGIMGGMKQIVTATAAFERMRNYIDRSDVEFEIKEIDADHPMEEYIGGYTE